MNIMTTWCTACVAAALILPAQAQPTGTGATRAAQPQPLASQSPQPRAPGLAASGAGLRPDPLDPAAHTLPLPSQTSLSRFRRDAAPRVGAWREANDTVGRIGGWKAYARMADGMSDDMAAEGREAAGVDAASRQAEPRADRGAHAH